MYAGLDLIKKSHLLKEKSTPIIASTPLFLHPNGQKISKTDKKALYLSRDLCDPHVIFDFFIYMNDDDAINYAPLLIPIEESELNQIINHHNSAPQHNTLQYWITENVFKILYGIEKGLELFNSYKFSKKNKETNLIEIPFRESITLKDIISAIFPSDPWCKLN